MEGTVALMNSVLYLVQEFQALLDTVKEVVW